MLTLCLIAAIAAPPPPLWAGLEPGRFSAGYRRLAAVDVWYPALRDGRPMTFRDDRHETAPLLLGRRRAHRHPVAAHPGGTWDGWLFVG